MMMNEKTITPAPDLSVTQSPDPYYVDDMTTIGFW